MEILFTLKMIQECVYRSHKLEQTQHSQLWLLVELGGVQTDRPYKELGWECLCHRRWYRRLCHFFKLLQSRSPGAYLMKSLLYNLRNAVDYEINAAKTNRFLNSYFYNAYMRGIC